MNAAISPSRVRSETTLPEMAEMGSDPFSVPLAEVGSEPFSVPRGEMGSDPIFLRAFALQLREQQHVADRRGSRQEHHEAVDADTETGSGRHAVLERADVVFVVQH